MEEQIEQAIRTTLVVTNKMSIKRCVKKIMKVVEQANQNKKWKNKQQNFTEVSESGTLKPYKGGSI